jgi:hypothetical protein
MPGVFVVALRAGNTDGVSDPVIFTFGIEPSGNVRPSGVLEVYIDLLAGWPAASRPARAAEATWSASSAAA